MLVEGIGSVLAGDGAGGGRILEPLGEASQSNLSFRWLALLWIARADLRSGALPAARAHVQEALTAARQLDIAARALSQWIAADVLAQDGDSTRAIAWLSESRSRFEKTGDRWGMGQTWLSEARVLTSAGRDDEAAEAARRAAALLPDSEEAPLALATQGAGAVFSGQLGSLALPDLLEFLRSGKRTGLLICSSASGKGALRFRDGLITGAASPSTPGVGELLVRARKVTPEALEALSATLGPDRHDPRLGERFVRDGLTDAPSVRKALEQLIGLAVRELMHWTEGEFTFNRETQLTPDSPGLAVALDPQGLLLNFFKELDEASRDAASP